MASLYSEPNFCQIIRSNIDEYFYILMVDYLLISLLLKVETSSHTEPDNFKLKFEKTLPHSDGQLQITELPINDTHLHHVRLKILSGYNHFVAVYKVLFDGK